MMQQAHRHHSQMEHGESPDGCETAMRMKIKKRKRLQRCRREGGGMTTTRMRVKNMEQVELSTGRTSKLLK